MSRSTRSSCVPSLSWKTISLKLWQPVFKLHLKIGLVEELRIRQPRAHDAAIARGNRRAAIRRGDIGDQHEFIGEFALCAVAQYEDFWWARIVARITSGGSAR